ncbi:restriction endonuclease subunit S [Desulfobulbus propionicus]
MNNTVPPGYKQTEVGVIPVDWEIKRLGEVAMIATGNTPPTKDISNYGDEFFFVGPVDMGDTKFISKTEKMLSKKGFAMSRRFPKDSILFVSIGSTIGKCGIAPVELTSNQQINAIFPSTNFSSDYLFYAISSAAQRIRSQAGEQAVPIVNKTQFSKTTVAFPPLLEQRAIAEALSDVDGLLAGLDRLITKKRDLKQAAMQQLLTGQTRLPGFHGEWEVKRLGDVGQFLKGSGVTKEQTHSGTLACVRYGELYTHHNSVIRGFYSWISHEVATTAVRLKKGDILFAGSGETKEEIGKCAAFVSNIEAYAGGDIVIFRPNDSDSCFLGYYLNTGSIARQKTSRSQGDAVVHISSSALSDILCKFPSLPEQTAIAEVLTDMDAELAALEQRRDKTRSFKQAMMQELLTGRTRLVKP